MKLLLLSLIFTSSLFSMMLDEYIKLSLLNSDDARTLVDNNLNTKLDYSLAENSYNINYSPISSFQANSSGDSITLGFQGDKRNIYGGTVYGSFDGTRGARKDLKESIYSSGVVVGYRQSLFRKFGEDYNTISLFTTKEKVKLIKLQNKEHKAAIILKAVGLYYDSVLNSAKIKIQEQSLVRVESDYKAAKAKQESGLVSKIDVYRAKLSFLDQSRNLNDSIKRYKDSIENLYFYLNQNVDDNASVDQTLAIKKLPYNIIYKDKSNILSDNLSWNEILLTEKVLKKQLYNADKDFLPDIEMDMNYKRHSSEVDINGALKFDKDEWNIGLNSNYSFNTTEQGINQQRLIIQRSSVQRDKYSLKRYIFKEIEKLKNDYQNIIENLEIYELKKTEAAESLDVAKIRYERGLSSNLDILDAEAAFSSSQIEYVSAILRHNYSLLNYAKAINELDSEFINRILQ